MHIEQLLEGSIQGVLLLVRGRIALANTAAAKYLKFAAGKDLENLKAKEVLAVLPEIAEFLAELDSGWKAPEKPRQATLKAQPSEGEAIRLNALVMATQYHQKPALQITFVEVAAQTEGPAVLQESNQWFQNLVEFSLHGIYVHRESKLFFVNQAFAEILGYDTVENLLAAGDTTKWVHPEDIERLKGYHEARLQGREAPTRYVHRAVKRDGSIVWLDTQVKLVDWEGAPAVQVVVVDVTQYFETRQALEKNQNLLQTLIDSIPQDVYLKDQEGRYTLVNRYFSKFTGLSLEETLGKTVMELHLVDEAADKILRDSDRQVLEKGESLVLPNVKFRNSDGEVGYRLILKSPLRDEEGNIVGVVGTGMDVTDLTLAQQELSAYQNLLQSVLDTIPLDIYVKDMNLRYKLVNRNFSELIGVPSNEMVGKKVEELEYFDDEFVERVIQADLKVLEQGSTLEVKDMIFTKTNGALSISRNIKTALRNDAGEIIGVVGVGVEETELKNAEKALRSNQELLHTVLDTLPQNINVKDKSGRYLMVNRKFAQKLGVSAEEIIGKTLGELKLYDEETLARINQASRRVMEEGITVEDPDLEATLPDGSVEYRQGFKSPLRDGEGKIIGTVGIQNDITALKKTENELRSSQKLLQTVIDTIPHNIYVKDRDSRYLMVNKSLTEKWGKSSEELLHKNINEVGLHDAASRKQILEADRQVVEKGETLTLPNVEITFPNEEPTYCHGIKAPLYDDEGGIVGLVGVGVDITDLIKVENELRDYQYLLQTVINTIPYAIFVKDLKGRFTLANKAMANIHGLQPEDVVGMRTKDLPMGSPAEKAVVLEMDREVLEKKRAVDRELVHFTTVEGIQTRRHLHKLPYQDREGNVVGIVAISENITERVKQQEEFHRQRALMQTVFDLLPMWLYVKDKDLRFLMINQKMADDNGVSRDIVDNRPISISAHLSIEAQKTIEEMDRKVISEGVMVEEPEFEFMDGLGRQNIVRRICMPFKDATGQIIGLVGLHDDITERKQTEEMLQQAQKLESLGVLAGGIAHDFNNLLVPIMGYTSLLLNKVTDNPALIKPLGHINKAAERAAELCREMLAYSGRGTFEKSPIDLNLAIQDNLELIGVSVPKKVELHYQLETNLPKVEADPIQINQVIMNLIINAAESMGENEGRITLSTGVDTLKNRESSNNFYSYVDDEVPEFAYLEVADTGQGMAKDVITKIFDPFFTTKFTGRGLGLAAVLGIVRGNHGALLVKSKPGQGTSFRLYLPLMDSSMAPEDLAQPAGNEIEKGTILVVDDEEPVRQLVGEVLDVLGFTVIKAKDGREGIEMFSKHKNTLQAVLLDFTMPKMNGLEALLKIRELNGDTPVVLMSGYSESEIHSRLSGEGFAAYLQKPFDFKTLEYILRKILTKSMP